MTFKDLQDAIKRGAVSDQAGTEFDDRIKDVTNRALLRISRDCGWRSMRRKSEFTTIKPYDEGSGGGLFHFDSDTINISGSLLVTNDINVGRRIQLGGSSKNFTIKNITGEEAITLTSNYDGVTVSSSTMNILGQEEYNLPLQAGHRMFMWHEEYGYPYLMQYVTDQDFYARGIINTTQGVPITYRMWGEDDTIEQIRTASTLAINSSNAADTSKEIVVFGTVAGYPDSEVITTDGTTGVTVVASTKTFQSVDRVAKSASTTGLISVTANSGADTIATIPAGDRTDSVRYKKVQLYPLPTTNFVMNVQYYKDPYRLVDDNDIHDMGVDFDQAIIYQSIMILKYEQNMDEGDKFAALFKDELRSLRKTNMDKIDWFPSLKRAKDSIRNNRNRLGINNILQYQQVGANYGPTVW